MIDIWLIFCQLVPFAQVVLLTAMELLREKEHEEKQISEQDEFQQAQPAKESPEGKIQFDVEDEPKPAEAWIVAPMKHSKTSLVLSMLAVFGRFCS